MDLQEIHIFLNGILPLFVENIYKIISPFEKRIDLRKLVVQSHNYSKSSYKLRKIKITAFFYNTKDDILGGFFTV
jgi:hypothetical protein